MPDLIPPQTYLDTIVDMGYTATETGPPGYFAPSAAEAAERAGRAGVELIATFLPLRLDDPAGFEEDLAALDRTVEVLEATGGGVVLLADMETPDRARAAGSDERRRETGWDDETFRAGGRAAAARDGDRARSRPGRLRFIRTRRRTSSRRARPTGFSSEPDIGLCVDTGHTVVGGGDPVALAQRYAARLRPRPPEGRRRRVARPDVSR